MLPPSGTPHRSNRNPRRPEHR